MKAKLAIVAFGGAVLLLAADQPDKPANRVEELEAKVAALESRVQRVEAQLADLSQPRLRLIEAPSALTKRPETGIAVPPHSGELEFNGTTFYMVPLGQPSR